MKDFLNEEELLRLRNHRYHFRGLSVMESVFEPYWQKLVSKLPKWLSPNALTLIGLLSVILPSSLVLYRAYHGLMEDVSFLSYFCSFGYLIWMNLDCMDGKLARQNRPNNQSPFGEILDHGGDAITLLIASASLGCQTGLHDTPCLMMLFVLTNVCSNYTTEPWAIYITGIMQFESIDFVEVTLLFSAISLLTGLCGTIVWNTTIIWYFDIQLRHLVFGFQMLIVPTMITGKLDEIRKSDKLGIADASGPAIPLIVVLLSALATYYNSMQSFLDENIILLTLCFGLTLVKIHVQLIILQMLKKKFNPLDYCLAFPVALSVGIFIFQSAALEKLWLFFITPLVALDTGIYFFRLLYQMYHAFDEHLFLLPISECNQEPKANKTRNDKQY